MREVEPQLVLLDLAAPLHRVLAERLVQGVVQNVRGGVGAADAGPPGGVDLRVQLVADGDRPVRHSAEMDVEVAVLLRVFDDERLAAAVEGADVADLPAGLGVEGRLVED